MRFPAFFILLSLLLVGPTVADDTNQFSDQQLDQRFANVQTLLKQFCLNCHSSDEQQGELDLERFSSVAAVRADLKPWQAMIQQLETREMPPRDELQPSDAQRTQLLQWTRSLLHSEALAHAGDPGRVPLHRLSHTEYDHTIRDLTGVDLQPTQTFPVDGAAGEGFTNAAEALNMSPALMAKYLNAAKQVAAHAVLLPDGFRFSPSTTRRDWTDESLAAIREFYQPYSTNGRLPLKPYLLALIKNREDLASGATTLETIAADNRLSPKYLQTLWQALNDQQPSYPLDRVRALWKNADEKDTDAIVAEVSAWSGPLWESQRIGSYVHTHSHRAKDPTMVDAHSLRFAVEPTAGQSEVVLYLVARNIVGPPTGVTSENTPGTKFVVWNQPQFENDRQATFPLRDYQQFGPQYEVDYTKLFADTRRYLDATVEAANTSDLPSQTFSTLAAKHNVDATWLKRWIEVLDLHAFDEQVSAQEPGREVPTLRWRLLDALVTNPERPAIQGWRPQSEEVPLLLANPTDTTAHVPGRISPHSVAVHPTPTEFVAVVWDSPIASQVQVSAKITHAHPACGNGVAYWLEKQAAARSTVFAEGALELGKQTDIVQQLSMAAGDKIILGIDSRANNHVCDLTEIEFTITEVGDKQGRVWNLAADVAANVTASNPHADGIGNKAVWSFVRGSANDRHPNADADHTANSLLSRWRRMAGDPAKTTQANALASQLQTLLTGPRPDDTNVADQIVYDELVSSTGALLRGIDVTALVAVPSNSDFGLPVDRFGKHPLGSSVADNSLVVSLDSVTKIRLPAELFREHDFVVEGRLDDSSRQHAVQFQILTEPPVVDAPLNVAAPVVAFPDGAGHQQLLAGLAEFRDLFPLTICYPHIIPVDEVVCLKTFHREDEPLIRLFLNDAQTQQLERLWEQHRFITKFPLVENEYLPLFIGFVTQDQPKEMVELFEGKRPEFQQRAEAFERDFNAAASSQLKQLYEFSSQAYRRPLLLEEQRELETLYQTLRNKGVPHEEAFRSLLARILVSPSFLLHLENAPPGKLAQPVNDWELASRLSYFLWSSMPDHELRQCAAEGRLHEPQVLVQQTQRMLQDPRIRALAIEFGTQWIHVRGFDQHSEKNEKLYPEFDLELRTAMYEESIRFFQHLFQTDASIGDLLDADYTFLNQRLAQHYGIPNVHGDQWRRVEGVKPFGRGGLLGLASVQTKQSGASRTSPILRGNWIVETLLGEKLPLPPADIPLLPDSETGTGELTTRQLVEQHVSAAECAVCHQKIDPFGFALEHYDSIGRRRDRDLAGRTLDTTAKLRDGTQFNGIEGLRTYLLTQKQTTITRLFCQRLLGYALGRSVSISDQPLLDQMMADIESGNDTTTGVLLKIVQSPQFQQIRGRDHVE